MIVGVEGEGVVDREVEWVIGWYGGNVGTRGYSSEQVGEFVSELLFSPMGGLKFLGMVAWSQGVDVGGPTIRLGGCP